MPKILLIHSHSSPLKEAYLWLTHNGFDVHASQSIQHAIKEFDLSLFQLSLIDEDDLASSTQLQTHIFHACPTIVLDPSPSISKSVDYMAAGAHYYLPLTTPKALFMQTVNRILAQSPPPTPTKPQSNSKITHNESGIIGQCPPMQELFSDMKKVSGTDVTVLIRGESGTGKELVAKALHDLSKRKDQPLISVNCAAIPENLIESELFGHEKGAFTGAVSARDGLIYAADNGTLFLDEIGELPLEAQARLLRVLQEGEIRRVGAVYSTKVNIRLVTATHRNLREMIAQGLFREDLYYRLYVMELILPPLRERGEDISLIAQALLIKACKKHQREALSYTKELDYAIRNHDWPGNVRELENAIERATILSDPQTIDPHNLKLPQRSTTDTTHSGLQSATSDPLTQPVSSNMSLDNYLKHVVLNNQHKMTETQLAQSLGISRKSLWERRQKLGIPKK